MIDYSDLINRIESMQDLPVSEEMLGAYCEGTLGSADAAVMDSCIANNAEIGELVDSVDNIHASDDMFSLDFCTNDIDDIDLPNVPLAGVFNPLDIDITPNIDDFGMVAFAASPAFCDITDDFVSGNDDFISDNDDSFLNDDTSIDTDDDINSDDSFDDLNPNK